MYADLHIHSNYSDSTSDIDKILEEVEKNNVKVISLTDHDSVQGINILKDKILEKRLDLKVIPGVEITSSIVYKSNQYDVHILGYFIDIENKKLNELINRNAITRNKMLEEGVKEAYYRRMIGKTWDEVVKENAYTDTIHITHIFNSMYGKMPSSNEQLRNGVAKMGLRFQRKTYCTCEDAIKAIKDAGGIAILAHPKNTCQGNEELFKLLVTKDFDGIEVFYPNQTNEDAKKYFKIVEEKNWFVTGGSDWHDKITYDATTRLGSYGLTEDLLENIM